MLSASEILRVMGKKYFLLTFLIFTDVEVAMSVGTLKKNSVSVVKQSYHFLLKVHSLQEHFSFPNLGHVGMT